MNWPAAWKATALVGSIVMFCLLLFWIISTASVLGMGILVGLVVALVWWILYRDFDE